ncbi:MAG: GNAT family N-acetyltransferase [Haliscomenobacter sp.]|nr:GNAT family N-acetyltransferase [Haliscomenobacter sp.]
MPEYLSFETDRLFLRPTTEKDAVFLLELLNSPTWLEYIGDRKVYTLEDARGYIQSRITPQLERLGYANYTLVRKADRMKIGLCGLYDREGLDGVDLGFALLPAFEKQGYAFEAARKLLEAGTLFFHIPEILAITTQLNHNSQKLLKKLGFRFVKTIRMANDPEELLLFAWNKYVFSS